LQPRWWAPSRKNNNYIINEVLWSCMTPQLALYDWLVSSISIHFSISCMQPAQVRDWRRIFWTTIQCNFVNSLIFNSWTIDLIYIFYLWLYEFFSRWHSSCWILLGEKGICIKQQQQQQLASQRICVCNNIHPQIFFSQITRRTESAGMEIKLHLIIVPPNCTTPSLHVRDKLMGFVSPHNTN
jgi:hypothetical protein